MTEGRINSTSQQLAEFIVTIENVQQELTDITRAKIHPINCVLLSRKLSLTRPFSHPLKELNVRLKETVT